MKYEIKELLAKFGIILLEDEEGKLIALDTTMGNVAVLDGKYYYNPEAVMESNIETVDELDRLDKCVEFLSDNKNVNYLISTKKGINGQEPFIKALRYSKRVPNKGMENNIYNIAWEDREGYIRFESNEAGSPYVNQVEIDGSYGYERVHVRYNNHGHFYCDGEDFDNDEIKAKIDESLVNNEFIGIIMDYYETQFPKMHETYKNAITEANNSLIMRLNQ